MMSAPAFGRELWKFSRPHTIIGTTLSLGALYVLALGYGGGSVRGLGLYLLSLLACLGANIFIVGLNQLTDIPIDRINKPDLPLASGAFSVSTGRIVIFVSLAVSLLLAATLGRWLLLTVVLSLLLGTLYSLPPVRLKRFHFWAAFCIIAVRGLIVNPLLFLHFHEQLNGQTSLPPLVLLLTATIFVYGIIIAWFKDLPDMEGDQAYAIHTLSLEVGARRVFRIGNALLLGTFALLIAAPFIWQMRVSAPLFSGLHVLLFIGLCLVIPRINLAQQASITRFYLTIWGFFFLEYIGFAAAGYLG